MFQRLKRRVSDMATIRTLCLEAEAYAQKDGQREPGAEHFLLAAFDLPDGTARRAFERAGGAPKELETAIAAQYANALRAIGLNHDVDLVPETTPPPAHGPYQAAPSGREVMQKLAESRRLAGSAPLVGADVVAVIATLPHGVSARALRAMGLELAALRHAAAEESRSAPRGSQAN